MDRNEMISYAMDFVSFLISRLSSIDRVILFGSIARGDFNHESDIDLFIDTKDKKLENQVKKMEDAYSKSSKARAWQLKGIQNTFSCMVGILDSEEWKDLKRGMVNNGLILYDKYKAAAEKIHQYTLFSFENIRPESARVTANRTLFGFRVKGKKYPGMAERYNLVKLGKGVILVPIEHSLKIKSFFHEKKITVKVYDVWSDYKL